MRTLLWLFVIGSIQPACAAPAARDTERDVAEAFSDLAQLKPMEPDRSYTVTVAGVDESGRKEIFLRRRSAPEISASGLASGCGDYAAIFIDRLTRQGYRTHLVDGAEISTASLASRFSGHAVVALAVPASAASPTWWLIDATNRRILSRHWSLAEKSFNAFGRLFWIGYCGPLEDYPAHGPAELKQFYAATLAAVPREVLNRTISRLEFKVDASLVDETGRFANPRLSDFLELQPNLFRTYGIEPARGVPVLLVRGADDAMTSLDHVPDRGWVARVGLQSACTIGLLAYFEQTVMAPTP